MAGNTKAVSNEEIIAALLANGTIKEAAHAAGISPRTVYDRMQEKNFRAEYMEAKSGIIRLAVFKINKALTSAIDITSDIMQDESVNPAIRLQAAQTILNNAGKFAKRLSLEESARRDLTKGPFEDLLS